MFNSISSVLFPVVSIIPLRATTAVSAEVSPPGRLPLEREIETRLLRPGVENSMPPPVLVVVCWMLPES